VNTSSLVKARHRGGALLMVAISRGFISSMAWSAGSIDTLGNDAEKILAAVADVFQTEMLSEYQPQYWGFDTDEELEVATETMQRENGRKRLENLRKFLLDEPHDLKSGTTEMVQAEIARLLISRDPELILEQNQGWLQAEIIKIYYGDAPF
jgi:hypothetical protein